MKNIDVVLIVPPSENFRQAEEHLGMGYLSSILKIKGIKSNIIDGFLGDMTCDGIEKKIKNIKPKIIGFSPYQDSLGSFSRLAGFARKELPDAHISVGGFMASFNFFSLFSCFPELIDSIIIGEGEISFSELAENIILRRDWKKTHGIVFREGQEIVRNPSQDKILDLNHIPFPDRNTIADTIFQKNPVHICASRGCYGNCAFCSVNAFGKLSYGNKWRGRSIKNVVNEIEMLQKNYQATYFKFIDDCWFPKYGKKKRAKEFCEEINKRDIKIKFRMSCRVDDVDYKVFKELKKCGLFSVSLGVESIIPRQLEEWKKEVTPEQNIAALEICKRLGIIVQMGYIMFDPDTTLEELKEHIRFLSKTKFTITKGIYSCMFAAEGTEITQRYKEQECGYGTKKLGINFNYSFCDEVVGAIAQALKRWTQIYGGIYSQAIDTLSAPKIISEQEQKIIWGTVERLKQNEIEILKDLIDLGGERNFSAIEDYITVKIKKDSKFMEETHKWLNSFYNKNHLPYQKNRNTYI